MAVLDTTWLYHTRQWQYLGPLDSTTLYHSHTWLYLKLLHSTLLHSTFHSTLALLDSTTLGHDSTWLYMTLLHSAMALHSSTWFYFIYNGSNLSLLHSTMVLLGSYSAAPHNGFTIFIWLYLTLVQCTMAVLLQFTMALLGSTWTLYQGSTMLYLTPLHSRIALLGSIRLYDTPLLYLYLFDCTTLYHGYTWLYSTCMTLLYCTMAVLDSTILYHGSTWLYLALLDSTTLYNGSALL